MLHRLAMGVGGLFLLTAAALASMVRIVPADAPKPVMAQHQPAPAPVPPPAAPSDRLVIPVQGVASARIVDSWGQSRANGARAHQGTDIMAPGGTPVVAAAAGTVEKLFYSHGGGGVTLYVRSPDRRWSYYYAHLRDYAPGVVEGLKVRAGDLLGYVGDTGNAGTGNFHLHFGVEQHEPGEGWWKGRAVNPYPLLVGGRR